MTEIAFLKMNRKNRALKLFPKMEKIGTQASSSTASVGRSRSPWRSRLFPGNCQSPGNLLLSLSCDVGTKAAVKELNAKPRHGTVHIVNQEWDKRS
jgi:hypothetical protein